MIDKELGRFFELIDSVFPIYRLEAGATTKALWFKMLKHLELELVAQAFVEHLAVNNRSVTPADIIKLAERICPDGRLGVDEAWAMMPRDEFTSVVMTEEMVEAWGIAKPLLDEGDQVAARMTFKEAYSRIVDQNRRNNIPAKWFPCLGSDKAGREVALADGMRLGRIGANPAIGLIAPDRVVPMLEMAGEQKLALEYKPPPSEESIAGRRADIQSLLKKFNGEE